MKTQLTDSEVDEIIIHLEHMEPKHYAPADGLGLYLGDGHSHPGKRLRSNELLLAFKELKLRRNTMQQVDSFMEIFDNENS